MLEVISLAEELRHSIETGNQIHACLALQWNETKDETPLEKRFGRRHEDRRQVWWLSPDDRNWLFGPLLTELVLELTDSIRHESTGFVRNLKRVGPRPFVGF